MFFLLFWEEFFFLMGNLLRGGKLMEKMWDRDGYFSKRKI